MSNLPFTLRQLDVFDVLARSESFRRTAEILGISQAAVSGQIKALESQLGVALFVRRPGRNPALTIEGRSFLQDLQAFRRSADALAGHRRQIPELDSPISVRVRVGVGLLDHYVRPALARFLAAEPAIELEFNPQPPDSHLAHEILDDRSDFGLFHLPEPSPVPTYLRSLAIVRGGVYGHRRFAEGKALPLGGDVISQLPFILPRAGSRSEKSALAIMKGCGIEPQRVVAHSQYFDVIATLLERGIGISSFSEAVLPPAMRGEVIRLHPLQDWRLVLYRRGGRADPRYDSIEHFLVSSVLGNSDYPAFERAPVGAG